MPETPERKMVHIRLPRALVKRLDRLAVEADLDRTQVVQRALEIGLPQVESALAPA
jgi:predicted transcriptional regulator